MAVACFVAGRWVECRIHSDAKYRDKVGKFQSKNGYPNDNSFPSDVAGRVQYVRKEMTTILYEDLLLFNVSGVLAPFFRKTIAIKEQNTIYRKNYSEPVHTNR